jgi:hypothetical protein
MSQTLGYGHEQWPGPSLSVSGEETANTKTALTVNDGMWKERREAGFRAATVGLSDEGPFASAFSSV